jgi:ATPase family AAA domain-containing protein 3A/B
MAAKLYSAGLAAAVASVTVFVNPAYGDGPFQFPSAGSSPSPPPAPSPAPATPKEETRVRNDNPRTTAAGFDPEALERGAKALREINSAQNAKKVRVSYFVEFI